MIKESMFRSVNVIWTVWLSDAVRRVLTYLPDATDNDLISRINQHAKHIIKKTKKKTAKAAKTIHVYIYKTSLQSSPSCNAHQKSFGYFMPLYNRLTAQVLVPS